MTRSRFWLIVTLLLAAITGTLVYQYLTAAQRASVDPTLVSQVVAKVKIAAGTKVTADMLGTEQVPEVYAYPSAAKDLKHVVGQFALVDFLPGEPVPLTRLASDRSASDLQYKVPQGMRAITVPVNSLTGVAGLVKPGNYVDVLVSYKITDLTEDLKVVTVVQNVLVLAVGPDMQRKDGVQAVENVTLAVAPGDTQTITLAQDVGKVHLVVRPTGEAGKVALPYVDVTRLLKMYP